MEPAPEINFVNTLFPVICIVCVIAIGVILLYSHFRKNLYKQMLEQEERERMYQSDLLRASIKAQEDERKRIAQDMHDELGATLSIARMHLVQLEGTPASKDHLEKLVNVRSLTETALASMRRISHELMPPQLETFGLLKTLADVVSQLNQLNGVTLQIETHPFLPAMPWPVTLGLYRIIMELINNTLKHASASEIRLTVDSKSDFFTFCYSDNGVGLAGDTVHKRGLGWSNMEARITSLHGSYSVDKDYPGFKIMILIPTNP